MNRTLRIATTSMVGLSVTVMGLMSPVAGSTTGVSERPDGFDAVEFFPMAVGNTWRWVDEANPAIFEIMTIADETQMAGHTVWVAETRRAGEDAATLYFVDHKDGLYATRYLDTLMDWAHDPDATDGLQRWTNRHVAMGTHGFRSGGAADAYTVSIEHGVPSMQIHNADSGTVYHEYAMGIGPVVRGGHLMLERATVGGIEFTM